MHSDSKDGGPNRPVRGFLSAYYDTITAAVTIVGIVLTVAGSLWVWHIEERDAAAALETRRQIVVDSTSKALSDATLMLTSVAGLYQASEEVSQAEFTRFVKKLGLRPGMKAIAFMPVVVARNLEAFETETGASLPGFSVYEYDENGEAIPARPRRIHIPVLWHEPVDAFPTAAGFDSASDRDRFEALERARLTRDVAATPLLKLVAESDPDGFLLYWPVTDSADDALIGWAAAPMDLSDLMEESAAAAIGAHTEWHVTEVTESAPMPANGVMPPGRLEIGGRVWDISITPRAGDGLSPDPGTALLILLIGLIATAFITQALYVQRKQRAAKLEFERLRELTQAKDQFLASVSHELRTPLTSVLGFAEILRSDPGDISEEDRASMLASVADEATDLASIVDDLLVAARSELDVLVVTKVSVSTRAQVAQVLEMSDRANRDQVAVIAEKDNPYRALGDPNRVRQILRNLITNAARYGGERVEIRLWEGDDWVHVEVADDGPGVAPEDVEKIFEPYYRAHTSASQPAALGIGLSVARQLARLMEGDLDFTRRGDWTVFDLRLPAAPPQEIDESISLHSITVEVS